MAEANPINGLCKKVMKVTDTHLSEMEEMARRQLEYVSPLRTATQAGTNRSGDYNMRVLSKLRELRDVLLAGPDGKS